jgi:hypothetical protein
VTPYFWNLAFQALAPPGTASELRATTGAGATSDGEYLLASGVLLRQGGGSLRPLFRVLRPPIAPPQGSAYCLRQEDSTAGLLALHCFDAGFVGDQQTTPDQTSFNVTVPWQAGTARVVLMQGANILDQRTVSEHPPTIEVQVSGTTASWVASDLDGDELAYMVLYSHDSGVTWQPLSGQTTATSFGLDTAHLPGGDNCLVRVRASDGVNTSYDDSAPFEVGRKPPQAVIYGPEADARFLAGGAIRLLGRGFDPEDGPLGEAVLQWASNRDGNLGTGSQALVTLSPGLHEITLTATDSDGMSNSASVSIFAGARIYVPIVRRGG